LNVVVFAGAQVEAHVAVNLRVMIAIDDESGAQSNALGRLERQRKQGGHEKKCSAPDHL
jgi:hypothetical protein